MPDVGVSPRLIERFDRSLKQLFTHCSLARYGALRDSQCGEITGGVPDLDEVGIDNAAPTIVYLEKIARVQVPVNDVTARQVRRVSSASDLDNTIQQPSLRSTPPSRRWEAGRPFQISSTGNWAEND